MLKKIKDNLKIQQRCVQKLLKELAVEKSEQINKETDLKYFSLHRTDGLESEFIPAFLKLIKSKDLFIFLTTIDDSGKGKMVLQGPTTAVDALGTALCNLLDGKGNGKNGRFQAKINSIKNLKECNAKVKEYFN